MMLVYVVQLSPEVAKLSNFFKSMRLPQSAALFRGEPDESVEDSLGVHSITTAPPINPLDLIASYRDALCKFGVSASPASSRDDTPAEPSSPPQESVPKRRRVHEQFDHYVPWANVKDVALDDKPVVNLDGADSKKRKFNVFVDTRDEVSDDEDFEAARTAKHHKVDFDAPKPTQASKPEGPNAPEAVKSRPTFSFGGSAGDNKSTSGTIGDKKSENAVPSFNFAAPSDKGPRETLVENSSKEVSPGSLESKEPASSLAPSASSKSPAFSFGTADTAKPSSNEPKENKTSTPTFSFGASSTNDTSTPKFSFGTKTDDTKASQIGAQKPTFSFNASSEKVAEKPAFSFGAGSKTQPSESSEEPPAKKPVFSFGSSASENSGTPSFSFGAGNSKEQSTKGSEPDKPADATAAGATKPTFTFGAPSKDSTGEAEKPVFSFAAPASGKTETPKFSFGATPTNGESKVTESAKPTFSFAPASNDTKKPTSSTAATNDIQSKDVQKPVFSFAGANVQESANGSEPKKLAAAPTFTFGGSSDKPAEPSFQSGAIGNKENDTKPAFTFGSLGAQEQKPGFSANSSQPSNGASSLFGGSSSGKTGSFGFGASTSTNQASQPSSGFSFGASGTNNTSEKATTPVTPGNGDANGGTPQPSNAFGTGAALNAGGKPQFGATNGSNTGGFSFGSTTNAPKSAESTGFSFGANAASVPNGANGSPATFGNSSTGFAFGSAPNSSNGNGFGNSAPTGFQFNPAGASNPFGGTASTGFGAGAKPFNFGGNSGTQSPALPPSQPAQGGFAFGANTTGTANAQSTNGFGSNGGFSFGASTGGGFAFGSNANSAPPSTANPSMTNNIFAAGTAETNGRKIAPIRRRRPRPNT